jgi:hypothetical protein
MPDMLRLKYLNFSKMKPLERQVSVLEEMRRCRFHVPAGLVPEYDPVGQGDIFVPHKTHRN